MKRRAIVIVLDSFGIGALPDAASFGDEGTNTLKSCFSTGELHLPNLCQMGLGNVEGLSFLGKSSRPTAAFGRMAEKSRGKDTTVGHWELAGLISSRPLPTYPCGFPEEVMAEFSRRCQRGWLCNLPFSGTEVIEKYGKEHLETGKLIVYTSADSVFQIAAHEQKVPLEELYRICRIARDLLQGEHGVGRVIARPFVTGEKGFVRTTNRHDYSIAPPGRTVLDAISEKGLEVISVGKIVDIFASRGITRSFRTKSNAHGIQETLARMEEDFSGLLFVNLVDFDSQYGHRNDAVGYARALSAFDAALPQILSRMRPEDLLVITADHGCDPGDASTDHTREYVPLLAYGNFVVPQNLGDRESFTDLAESLAVWFGLSESFSGKSFLSR